MYRTKGAKEKSLEGHQRHSWSITAGKQLWAAQTSLIKWILVSLNAAQISHTWEDAVTNITFTQSDTIHATSHRRRSYVGAHFRRSRRDTSDTGRWPPLRRQRWASRSSCPTSQCSLGRAAGRRRPTEARLSAYNRNTSGEGWCCSFPWQLQPQPWIHNRSPEWTCCQHD